jgi:hypothetical protein
MVGAYLSGARSIVAAAGAPYITRTAYFLEDSGRISENPLKAKFAELLFYEVR